MMSVFFSIYGQFAATQKLDSRCMDSIKFTFSLTVTFYLTKPATLGGSAKLRGSWY